MEINPGNFGSISKETSDDILDNNNLGQSDDDNQFSHHGQANQNPVDATSILSLTYAQQKWQRLRKFYNDHYLDFFNIECRDDQSLDNLSQSRLFKSQLGAVVWSTIEKDALFTALARHGRHNLPRLSRAVGTKSPVEITTYLDAIHNTDVDRQLFLDHPKNVSMSEIPAAIEIGMQCEEMLNLAADALNAYQEQYDITAGQRERGISWLIERQVAAKLDAQNDNEEVDIDQPVQRSDIVTTGGGATTDYNRHSIVSLFKLSTMLDLSEQFFMNLPEESLLDHWHDVVEPGQRPSMTEDVVENMFDLVINRLREILRMSIRVADVRLSSMASSGYNPSQKLTLSDVSAALDILDMPKDAWAFWTGLARRNKLHVVTGSHSKGETRSQSIAYDVVEATLAIRRGRGRRRSMSIGSDISSAGSDLTAEIGPELSDGSDHDQDGTGISDDDGDDFLNNRSASDTDSLNDSDSNIVHEDNFVARIGQGGKKDLLEDDVEEYSENVDQAARRLEEGKLSQVLRKRSKIEMKEEEEEDDYKLGPQPKQLRKTKDELTSWSCTYAAEWETFGRDIHQEHSALEGPIEQTDIESSEIEAGR